MPASAISSTAETPPIPHSAHPPSKAASIPASTQSSLWSRCIAVCFHGISVKRASPRSRLSFVLVYYRFIANHHRPHCARPAAASSSPASPPTLSHGPVLFHLQTPSSSPGAGLHPFAVESVSDRSFLHRHRRSFCRLLCRSIGAPKRSIADKSTNGRLPNTPLVYEQFNVAARLFLTLQVVLKSR